MSTSLAHTGEYTWEVWLQDANGVGINNLSFLQDFQFTRNVSSPGFFSVTLPLSEMESLGYLASAVRETLSDKIVSFWRGNEGEGSLQEVFAGYVTRMQVGMLTLTLSGSHLLGLLKRRIIAYHAGSSYASKTAKIDDMMKAIVRENLGSSATDTDRQLANINVETDEGVGISVTRAFSRDNVLEALQALATLSHQTATPVPIYFDLERNPGASGFIFRTYPNQRGTDKSSIIPAFSVDMGNLEKPEYIYDLSEAASVIYVGGADEAASRLVVEVEDTSLSALSPVGRRERFLNDTRLTDTTQATTRGQQALQEYRPFEVLKGTIQNTPTSRFQQHWNFGDKVKILHAGQSETVRINNLNVSLSRSGQERITSNFEKVHNA